MTFSERSMCTIPYQGIGSPLSSLFLIRPFVELRVGNEKKHTCFTYIAKSKTGRNKENRSYNQIKTCVWNFFGQNSHPFLHDSYLYFKIRAIFLFLFSFSFFPCFWAWILFHFSFAQPTFFLQYEESYQSDGIFLCGWKACFCVTSSVEVSI